MEEFCSLHRNCSHLRLHLRFLENGTACKSAAVQMFLPFADKMIDLVYDSEILNSSCLVFPLKTSRKLWPSGQILPTSSHVVILNWEFAISCPDGEQTVHCCLKRRLVPPLLHSKVPRWGEDMHYFTSLTTLLELSPLESQGLCLQKQKNQSDKIFAEQLWNYWSGLWKSVYFKMSQAIDMPGVVWPIIWVSAVYPRKLRYLFLNYNSTRNHGAYTMYFAFWTQQVDLKLSHPHGIVYCNMCIYTHIYLCSFYCGYFCALNCTCIVKHLFLSRSVAVDRLSRIYFKISWRCS